MSDTMDDTMTSGETAEWYHDATEGEIEAALQAVFVGGYKQGQATPKDGKPTTEDVLSLVSELGSAWRGDWNDFDGRQLRSELDDLYPYSQGLKTKEQVRAMWGVCPLGRGHWNLYCSDYNCGEGNDD